MDNQFLPVPPNKRQIERGAVSKAIYMVTDLFADSEPLRSALRTVAIDILKDKGEEHTIKLKSLLILSREVGLISELNTEILVRAIQSIETDQGTIEKTVDISKVLEVSSNPTDLTQPEERVVISPKYDIVQDKPQSNPVQEASKAPVEVEAKKPEKTPASSPSITTTLDIGTRRKKILEVVRSKGQATIHEFIQSIQGCSSKTIQRELTSLVLSGTLKKTGERRWSKYSLR